MIKIIAKILTVLAISFSFNGFTQENNTLHFLKLVPQARNTNPAFPSNCKYSISAPLISSFGLSLSNSFTIKDVFNYNSEDSLQYNWENVINKIDENGNYLSLSLNTDIFRASYKYNKQYEFNFNVSEHVIFKTNYSKNLVKLMAYGQQPFLGTQADLSNNSIYFTHYREYGFGVVKTPNTKFTLGARVKLLFGKSNLDLKPGKIILDIDSVNFGFKSTINPDFNISGLDSTFSYDLISSKNFGLGVDLGFTYTPNNKTNIAFSIIDIGQIKWTNKVLNFKTKKSRNEFNGANFNEGNKLNEAVNQLGIDTTSKPYKTMLPAKTYLSITRKISKPLTIGALISAEFLNSFIEPAITLQGTLQVGEFSSIISSYSIYNNSYLNFGLGYAINAGPAQLYFSSSNIAAAFDYANANNFNFRIGMNLLFGIEHDKRLNYKRKRVNKKSWMAF